MGGKGGRFYFVTDSSDYDTMNPTPGTLRHAVIQDEPLWIVFNSNMVIKLKHELIVNNYKTIDGRGANVQITGNGCITLRYVRNIIIHSVQVYNCLPSSAKSNGDGISIVSSTNIWIDHCTLSHCTDGLIDVIMGSTAITISNNLFSHHDDEVMLLGHDDNYLPDSGMQVTIAFNRFGEGLVQGMPRCRRGYIHVVNNDFVGWKMYAIGGSASPTIISDGNRYTAPTDPSAKEITRREDTTEGDWLSWNWTTDGDIMLNGAFFVASGEGANLQYDKDLSLQAKSASVIDQLTMNAGAFGGPSFSLPYGGGGAKGDGSSGRFSATGDGGSGSRSGSGYSFGAIIKMVVLPTLASGLILYLIKVLIKKLCCRGGGGNNNHPLYKLEMVE